MSIRPCDQTRIPLRKPIYSASMMNGPLPWWAEYEHEHEHEHEHEYEHEYEYKYEYDEVSARALAKYAAVGDIYLYYGGNYVHCLHLYSCCLYS